MATIDEEYFGQPPQQGLQRRGDDMWRLLKNDPRFSCHGRAVGLAGALADNTDTQIALARLQGVGSVEAIARSDVAERRRALEAAGLQVDMFVNWRGGPAALAAAHGIVRNRPLPDDLKIVTVDGETSADEMAKLDALTGACGVLLPMGGFMRGLRRPAVCLYARDRRARVVGTSAAVAQFHPDHAKAGHVWWGMLATDEMRRGQGIALILGALSMRAMRDRFGYRSFFTGIREGNTASERLCRKLGFTASDSVDMIAIAPEVFAAGRLTK